MQCPSCPDRTAEAFCRNCGRAVCSNCKKDWNGVPHCEECYEKLASATGYGATVDVDAEPIVEEPAAADVAPGSPEEQGFQAAPEAPPPPSYAPQPSPISDLPQPFLAGLLGLIPGLGAVYNGQYVKGFLHVALFGLFIAIADATEAQAPFVFMALFMLLYMPIEAVRTAKAMRRGEKVDELSGLIGELLHSSTESPAIGVTIIAAGVLLLLFNLGVFRFEAVVPFWPILLIAFGIFRLYQSIMQRRGGEAAESQAPSARPDSLLGADEQ